FVLGLDVVHDAAVLDVGIEAGDHVAGSSAPRRGLSGPPPEGVKPPTVPSAAGGRLLHRGRRLAGLAGEERALALHAPAVSAAPTQRSMPASSRTSSAAGYSSRRLDWRRASESPRLTAATPRSVAATSSRPSGDPAIV